MTLTFNISKMNTLQFLLLVVCVFSVLWGFYSLYFETEINRCSMTYMFEMPRYHKLSLNPSVAKKFRNYDLYYYTEGYRSPPQVYSGIPVLFIPGNAGSYKQVRSMGSVALRMGEESQYSRSFDYFSVDLDEELGALSGKYLTTQTDFVSKCIDHILSLYESSGKDRSVLIIAHSMGGIVARNLFLTNDFRTSSIHSIITLATPHVAPVVGFDKELVTIYRSVDDYWTTHHNSTLRHVTLISLVGGSRDIQVWDGHGDARSFISSDRHIWISTTGVTRAWASTDHLCIIWCKELCLNLNRALFEMIDATTGELSVDPDIRIRMFKKYLTPSSIGDSLATLTQPETPIANIKWKHYKKSNAVFSRKHVAEPIYLHFTGFKRDSKLFFSASGVNDNWLFICSVASSNDSNSDCLNVRDLSSLAQRLPPRSAQRKMMILDSNEVLQLSESLVVRVDQTDSNVEVMYEEFNREERFLTESLNWLTGRFSPLISISPPKSVFYRIAVPNLRLVTRPARVSINTVSCKRESASMGLMTFTTPWNNGFGHNYISSQSGQNTQLAVQLSRNAHGNLSKDIAFIDLFLNPSCQYSVHLYFSPIDMVAQIFRMNVAFLPLFFLCHLMFLLANQLDSFLKQDAARSLSIELLSNMKAFIPMSSCCYIASLVESCDWYRFVKRELSDWSVMVVLPIVSFTVLYVAVVVMEMLVYIVSAPIRKIGFGNRLKKFSIYLHIFFLGLAVLISWRSCYGLGLILLIVSLFNEMCFKRACAHSARSSNLLTTVFLLVCLLAMFKIPEIVVFAKNVTRLSKYQRSLEQIFLSWPGYELFPLTCLPTSISLLVLVWYIPVEDSPTQRRSGKITTIHWCIPWILRALIVLSIFVCGIDVNLLSFTLTGSLVLTALLMKLEQHGNNSQLITDKKKL